MAQHAYLSPSAAHRWLHCTSSPSLEATMPDSSSVYADEGTLAHAICEAKLKGYLHKEYAAQEYEMEYGEPWTDHPLYKEEMDDTTDYYTNTVIGLYEEALKTTPDARLLVEQKVSISGKLFGTADALIVADGLLNVIDYKHGKGVEVSAEENPQMMIYALAAYMWHSTEYDIEEVTMTIVQPRIGNTSSWNISAKDLNTWGSQVLIPTATKILQEKDLEQHAGTWCRFCKVKAQCKALKELATETTTVTEDPRLLTLNEIAEILPKIDVIKQWCEDLSSYALEQALSGKTVTGYKVVEGRSRRVITNQAALADVLKEQGFAESMIYRPREMESLTTLEKLVGKKKFAEQCGAYIDKPQGKPTLVTLSDKRPEWHENELQHDFGDIIE